MVDEEQQAGRILVIDDDHAMHLLVQETLEKDNVEVRCNADGLSALATYDHFLPHLVLLDANMPGMDGFTVCSEIRKREGGEDVTIVMVTGLSDDVSIQRAYNTGAMDFMYKPINLSILRQRVLYLLQARKAFISLSETTHHLRSLDRISHVLATYDNQAQLFQQLCDEIRKIFTADRAVILAPATGNCAGLRVCCGSDVTCETPAQYADAPLEQQVNALLHSAHDSEPEDSEPRCGHPYNGDSTTVTRRPGMLLARIRLQDGIDWGLCALRTGQADDWTSRELYTFEEIAKRIQETLSRHFLMESRLRLAGILQATPDLVGTMNTDRRMIYLNESARRTCCIDEKQATEEIYLRHILPHETHELVVDTGIPKALSDGIWQGQGSVQDRYGRKISVLLTLIRHRSGENSEEYLSFIMKDISELLKKEAQIQHSEKIKAIGQMASGIAHDFGNMMTILKGNLELIEEDLVKHGIAQRDSEVSALLQDALSVTSDGTSFTQQLLNIARSDRVTPRRVAIRDTIDQFHSVLKRLLGDHIELTIEVAPQLPEVMVDPGQLESTILNLALNAHDAMPSGGALDINIDQKQVTAAVNDSRKDLLPGDYVIICVKDTGIGMNNEILSKACEPFFSTKSRGNGTGLGLCMAQNFAEQAGGTLIIESKPEQGTRVSLLIPALSEPASENASKPDVPCISPDHKTILVVEDRAPVRRYAVSCFERIGYTVLDAGNAPAARAILDRGEPVDILFCDILMPGDMNGFQLAAWTRQKHPEVLIQLTTAADPEKISVLDSALNDLPILRKPYSREELEQAVSGLLRARHDAAPDTGPDSGENRRILPG